MKRILVVDNYDSATYTLVDLLTQLGAPCAVKRCDTVRPEDTDGCDGVLLGPGPGIPETAGACIEIVRHVTAQGVALLGVGLGYHAIAVAAGASVGPAPELMPPGRACPVYHRGSGVLQGLPSPVRATCYHTRAVDRGTLPLDLEVTAHTDNDVVMAVRHWELPAEGVQFEPGSVRSEGGVQMLANWLVTCGDAHAVDRAAAVDPVLPYPLAHPR